MVENSLITQENIKYKIYKIRDTQVMLDSDLAELYAVPTKALNQAVKRNQDRFPTDFLFQLTERETEILKSQFVTSSLNKSKILKSQIATSNLKKEDILRSQIVTTNLTWAKKRVSPFVFTEQGVASLSGVLKSKRAIEINIQIMRAFVSMRKFISRNVELFEKINYVESKQIDYQLKSDKNFKIIFDAIENKEITKKQGIFFDGQVFDAHSFISDLIRSAKISIILIDNYVDDSVLKLFRKTKKNVSIKIYTEKITPELQLDLKKYNLQYSSNPIEIKLFKKAHDRFLIIDNKDIYHIGASIKDAGKKWFAFSKIKVDIKSILNKLD